METARAQEELQQRRPQADVSALEVRIAQLEAELQQKSIASREAGAGETAQQMGEPQEQWHASIKREAPHLHQAHIQHQGQRDTEKHPADDDDEHGILRV